MESNSSNIIVDKSFAFSVRIIRLYQWLKKNHKDIDSLAKQILRSGTSIGANVEEAVGAFSRKEFASKIGISYKETRETLYWLRLLKATDYLDENQYTSIYSDCDEIKKILASILKTTRENND
ncbi:four helix bundle protein [Emticicia sp. W12TSBA100-4]|uniref:four helix bundle protein n=1 Tax=Emticicia sp. W12TSBA100-4 TaxID=3160965 RepID=UPI003305C342